MKRQKLLKHLREHDCRIEREGGGHTVVINSKGKRTTVPRHREIEDGLVRAICKQLDVPPPSGT